MNVTKTNTSEPNSADGNNVTDTPKRSRFDYLISKIIFTINKCSLVFFGIMLYR